MNTTTERLSIDMDAGFRQLSGQLEALGAEMRRNFDALRIDIALRNDGQRGVIDARSEYLLKELKAQSHATQEALKQIAAAIAHLSTETECKC